MAEVGPAARSTPTLMRAARGAYASSIRAQLHSIGIEDLPRNGAFILAGLDTAGGPSQDLPSELGVSKQAVSQLVDTLVRRGYVERGADPDDRRRIALELTERGRQAVAAVVRGVEAVDRQLHERFSPGQIESMRSILLAMAEIKGAGMTSGAAVPRPARQLRRVSPIFPVRDLAAALAHYAALGFDTFADAEGAQYGFALRDGIGLHLARDAGDTQARQPAGAYLYVRDADAIYEEWNRPAIAGRTRPVRSMPYGLREGSHTDPDGNVIRFGSPQA